MKILHIDIETAPHKVYAWGLYDQDIAINQIVEPGYTLCWAAKWHGKPGVMFDSMRSGKRRMIRHMHDLMCEADAITHYNGLRFDIPTLNKEFLELGLTPPTPAHHIDLFQTAKRRFRFASNKLDFVAQTLGLGKKYPHKGMELWHGCMNNDPKCWQVMERYNVQDVRLLERVYLELLPWITNHPNQGNYASQERVCPSCGSPRMKSDGLRFSGVSQYRRLKCLDCGAHAREPVPVKRLGKDGKALKVLRQV